MSKLIKTALPSTDDEEAPTLKLPVVETTWDVPLDVQAAIVREAERDPSDPYVARRLIGHYRQGIWGPQDARK
jgi:hypothetical protein